MTLAYEDLRAIAELVTDLLATADDTDLESYGEDIADALEGLSAVADHIHMKAQQKRRRAAA